MASVAPSVSVVLPTHNRRATLGAAIESVLTQSWSDLELIVVDDASTDGSDRLVRSMDDVRLQLHRLPRRSGAPIARNVGISMARGRYVGFQDSDDVWRPDKLRAQVAALDSAEDDVAVVYGAMIRHRSRGAVRIPGPSRPGRSGDPSAQLSIENFIGLPAALVRTDAVRSTGGFDPDLPRFQDWDLWLRMAETFCFQFLDEVVVDSHETSVSISRDEGAYFRAMEVILSRHDAMFRRCPEALLHHHLRLALLGLARRRALPYGHHAHAIRSALGWRPLLSVAKRSADARLSFRGQA